MSIKGVLLPVALSVLSLLVGASAAAAVDAAAKSAVNVRTGPSTGYGIVDQLTSGEVVTITECAPSNFCFVQHDGPDGWVSAGFLVPVEEEEEAVDEGPSSSPDCSFGFNVGPSGPSLSINCGDTADTPIPPPPPPPADDDDDEEETVACFYTGSGFTGDEFCVGPGTRNALNGTFQNKISSVQLLGGAKARLCDEVNLGGYCRNVTSDSEVLSNTINNKASSLVVFTGVPPLPAPPPPVVPATFSTGPIDLMQTYLANLDNGAVGSGGADVWYQAVTNSEKYLTPRNGALLGLGNGSNRGYMGCLTETFSNERIALEDVPPGTYVCARTNQGRISQFRVNGFAGTTIKLGYTTWAN